MAIQAENNEFPYVTFLEHVDPSTPAAGRWRLFVDTDNILKLIDDAGTVTNVTGSAVTRASLGLATSDSPEFAGLNIGHASDTTLARSAAGILTVEGNRLFAVGGADVPIADGGTGASTATAAFDALSPMTTAGDLIIGGASGTRTRLAAGATSGHVLTSTGSASAPSWQAAAGGGSTELAYVEFTANVAITATTEATANSVVSAGALSFNGSTRVKIEFYAEYVLAASGASLFLILYDGSSSIGILGQYGNGVLVFGGANVSRFLTPSNASHTYSVRAYGAASSNSVNAGAGGSGNAMPGYIRITTA